MVASCRRRTEFIGMIIPAIDLKMTFFCNCLRSLTLCQGNDQNVEDRRLTICAVCAGIFAIVCSRRLTPAITTHTPAAVYENSTTDL